MNSHICKKESRGAALLLEHLPDKQGYQEGVLFLIFSNGESFFYPLEPFDEPYNTTAKNLRATLLSSDSSTFTRSDYTEPVNFHVHDVELEESDFIHVHEFSFIRTPQGICPPRKIQLSPNKKLLLIFGVQFRGQSCVVVYQILDTPHVKEIFFDLTLSFVDVCFTPDSDGLLVVPRHNPSIVMLLSLPICYDERNIFPKRSSSFPFRNGTSSLSPSQQISFEPRHAGPLCVFGPTVNVFGRPLEITHIEANEYASNDEIDEESEEDEEVDWDPGFHFVTWNDEGLGDYCLWHISWQQEKYIYHCFPRLLSNVHDENWLADPLTPTTTILEVRFHQYNLLCFLTQRKGFQKQNANGVGLQMVQLPEEFVETDLDIEEDGTIVLPQVNLQSMEQWRKSEKQLHPSLFPGSSWFKVSDNSIDKKDILCMKWGNPLMLGSSASIGLIIKGVGLFELVDHRFASKFQDNGRIEEFSRCVTNFYQLYSNYRFWTTDDGKLRVLVVTPPKFPTESIEWAEFVDKQSPDYWAMKMFGNKFGYFINDLKEDPEQGGNYLEFIYNNWRKTNQKKKDAAPLATGAIITSSADIVYRYTGMHLYRCWQCRRVLLKPLQCSKCKSVAYCGEMCQRKHWKDHKEVCTEGGLFYPHKFVK